MLLKLEDPSSSSASPLGTSQHWTPDTFHAGCYPKVRQLLACEELKDFWQVAMQPWPQVLKYHSAMFLDYKYLYYVLNRPTVSAQQILDSQGACLQGGLAVLWRLSELDGKATKRYIDRQEDQWPLRYPRGLDDARDKI